MNSNTQYPVPSTLYPVPSAQCPVENLPGPTWDLIHTRKEEKRRRKRYLVMTPTECSTSIDIVRHVRMKA